MSTSSSSSSSLSLCVRFADTLTEIYEVPSLKEEERQKLQCNTNYKSCLWVSLEEYEKRRHIDNLIVQGIAMGTINKQQVCVRGLESKLCRDSTEDTTYSDYDNETYRKQVVDTVLEEQRKQRLGGCKNDEEIASKCLDITADCQQDAVQRGHKDSLDVHGQCCCTQQQQQQESPSSNISTASNTSSTLSSSSTTTPCDCCCLEDNEDGLVRNRHSMVVIQPRSKRRQSSNNKDNKKSPKSLWKQMVKKTRRSFTNMTFSGGSSSSSSS
jgi:hypothetical protein